MEKTPYYSYKLGNLPKGCQYCVKGRKTVLFITGLCASNCYFCPISDKKKNKDVVYVNEWPTNSLKDCFNEIQLCRSRGAGITGGDPLARLERTCNYIKALKKKFGKKFHIHLYTPLYLVTKENLKKLHDSGLDEIRFHPNLDVSAFWNRIKLAGAFKWDIGVEIPVVPGKESRIIKLIDFIKKDINFLNLNELEISDTNASRLVELGYKAKDNMSYAVKGSGRLAKKILKYCEGRNYCEDGNFGFDVHYCTTRLKDRVQLAERIKRRAANIKKDYDVVDEEGIIMHGAVYVPELAPGFGYNEKIEKLSQANKEKIIAKLDKIRNSLKKRFDIPNKLIDVDKGRPRVLIAPWVLEEIHNKIKLKVRCAFVKEYPTWDRLIVELEFL